MKIAVIGADTLLGKKIVLKAEQSGINVVSVLENPLDMVGNGIVLLKRYDALTLQDIAKCHALIDTISCYQYSLYKDSIMPFVYLNRIKPKDMHLIVAGRSAFLYADKYRKSRVYDSLQDSTLDKDENLDKIYQNFMSLNFTEFNNWTVLCPPLIVDTQGYGHNNIKLSDDVIPISSQGSSYISLEDYANAFIELLKQKIYNNTICSVYV